MPAEECREADCASENSPALWATHALINACESLGDSEVEVIYLKRIVAWLKQNLLLAKKEIKSSKTVCVLVCVSDPTDVEYTPIPCVRRFLSYLRLLCSCPELIAVPTTQSL